MKQLASNVSWEVLQLCSTLYSTAFPRIEIAIVIINVYEQDEIVITKPILIVLDGPWTALESVRFWKVPLL
jgi:hypothetical protein